MLARLPLVTALVAVWLTAGINAQCAGPIKGLVNAAESPADQAGDKSANDKRIEKRPDASPDVVSKASERKGAEVDKRAEPVLREAAKALTAIHGIEFRAESEGTLASARGGMGPVKYSYFFRSSGNLYRDDELDSNGVTTESYSFNGSMFQFFSETLSAFRESKHWMGTRPQTSFLDPISQAYSWVYPTNAPRSWDTLRSRESWDDVARRTRFIGEVKSDGRTIVTLEVERRSESGKTFALSVQFDKDHGCAPIVETVYSLPDRSFTGTTVVKRFSEVDAGDAGHIRLPIEVEMKWAAGDVTHRIVENTLRINQPIDANVFTLPRSRARTNWGPYGLDEKTADFFKPRGPLADRLATAQDDARRNDQRVLLILGDADSDASQKLFDLREKNWRRPLYDYQQVAIAKSDSAAVDSFKKTYPDIAALQWPAFVVVDEAGKVLASRSLSLSGADTAAESAKVTDFLASHAPERLDAEKLLAGAVARARRDDKKVFLEETGIYCAPCKLLAQYYEKHQEILDANFIFLKLDPARLTNGPAVMKRLRTSDDSGGIPWIAILDADGKVLQTCLGFPSDAKDSDGFIQLFAKTAPRLTEAQLATLRSDLDRKP